MTNEPVFVWLESKLNKKFFIVLINEDLSQTNICTVDSKAQAKELVKKFNEDLKRS